VSQGRRSFLQVALAGWARPWRFDVQAAEPVVQVEIRDYRFIPDRLTIQRGTTVRWVNLEKRSTHSVLFTGPGGFESERFFPGETWQRTFHQPGSYPYGCGPHPEMKGHVEVEP
jgi:plastocyanin